MSLIARLLGGDDDEAKDRIETAQDAADDALDASVNPDTHGLEEFGITGVAVVNEGPDGEPVTVPIARFSLGKDVDELDRDSVWPLVAAGVEAMFDAFDREGVFVRHYDVQFAFGGKGLFEAEECRRVAIHPELAERFVADREFDADRLREVVEREDDIDDVVAPVAWGECEDYSAASNAAVVTTAAVGASAASCGGAGGAGGC
ncbi:hypothetical protein [Halorussus amylolyticus]|uniref:hypothetical protein n=1 Tax=Halorussus amylolyticus TaxID=1126242 RepID=UPI001045783A|nr:hypothetical protein [Halorussus amylolyticus]